MLKKEILKSKNNVTELTVSLSRRGAALKKLHKRVAADDTTALLTVNSVTVCVKFI